MKHVMIDLETLGTQPGSVILSIGAVLFDPNAPVEECLGKEFYCVVSTGSCKEANLEINQDTLDWWDKQSAEARTVIDQAAAEGAFTLTHALEELAKFIPAGALVWSNGANFDQPLLDVAYNRVSVNLPWKYYNSRCYRTIKALCSRDVAKALEPATVCAHNALEDAKWQALHMAKIVNEVDINVN